MTIWWNPHFYWLTWYSEYSHYLRFIPVEQHYSKNLNFLIITFIFFLEVLLQLHWTSTFFGLSLTLLFRASPCNVALNCGLTFPLSSNHILIFSFYLNTLQKHRINNDTDIFLATLLNPSFLLPLLKTVLQQKK